jgi:glycosyltransferase involved in cell wall biosynthesis
MRVAIYIRTIASAQGTERVTANIATGLAERGHQVDFLVEVGDGWLLDKLDAHPNITVINLRDRNVPPLLHRGFQLWILLKNLLAMPLPAPGTGGGCNARLVRVMGHENPPALALYRYIRDAAPVSVMSFLNHQNLVLLLVAPFVKGHTRMIVNVRNHITTSARRGKSSWMRSVPRIMRRFFPRADLVVAPSRGVAEDIHRITAIPFEKISVVNNPVFRPEILELAAADPGHPWLDDPGVPLVIAAGKLKAQKDFETLLRAFAIVHSRRRSRLMILGRGPDRQMLLDLASELGIAGDFELPGHVKNPYAYFRRAGVFVLSSAWEGLPNVLIEAMACGCPVVSTDCPSGPSEILDGGRVGRLVPVGDAQRMAEAISATLDSPPGTEELVRRARKYSFDAAISAYETLLGVSPAGSAAAARC